jgi:dehydrogenase/reductase SDR family protein 7B
MQHAGASGRFEDQVVWITGASAGIGAAVARAFAREGARLILSARRREELERVAAQCAGARGVDVLPLDLGDTPSLSARAREALALAGHVDVMVHNAGISQRARAIETSIEVDERLLRVNYLGTVALTKALLPAMVARRRGQFVVVTSLTGLIGTPLRSSYAASKHALHGFFDSLRAEHHGDGIAVTIVAPGFVRTDVSINALRGDGAPQGTMDEATARGIDPDDCARTVVTATARRREEVYVGGFERVGVYLKRLSPRLLARFLRNAKVT